MPVRVRPITQKDAEVLSRSHTITSYERGYRLTGNGHGTILDTSYFNPDKEILPKGMVSDDIYRNMAKIVLPIACVNPFLAGKDFAIWRAITGWDSKTLVQLNNGQAVLDRNTMKTVTDLKPQYNPERHLFGAEAFKAILASVDVEERLKSFLWEKYLKGVCSPSAGKIYRDKSAAPLSEGWLLADWFYQPGDPSEYELPVGYSNVIEYLEDHVQDIAREFIDVRTSPIYYILRYMDNPEALLGTCMSSVLVLPTGFRPTIEDRVDYITTVYNDLAREAIDLQSLISYRRPTIRQVRACYSSMMRKINNLYFGLEGAQAEQHVSYVSLMEQLTGKGGLPRDKMYAGRVDFSGRTVINCDPKLSYDEIGVPYPMLEKLAQEDIIKALRERECYKDANLCDILNDKSIQKQIHSIIDMLCKENYVTIGRQPTLWNLGIQAFRPVPTTGKSITVSPLIVEPFNADFDGDQMHIEWINSPEAKAEVAEHMYSANNIFYPKDGSFTAAPRLEILLGLYIATHARNEEKARTWTEQELREISGAKSEAKLEGIVYNCVVNHKIQPYDYVDGNLTYTYDPSYRPTAGVIAIKFVYGPKASQYAIGVVPLRKYDQFKQTVKQREDGTKETIKVPYKDKDVTDAWVKAVMIDEERARNSSYFVNATNKSVTLGFELARWFPPSIAITVLPEVKDLIDEFNQVVSERLDLVTLGFELPKAYTNFYGVEYEKLEKKILDRIKKTLPEDSGYRLIVESGARGKMSNLMQVFGIKGRTMKNASTPFNSIVPRALATQLSSLDHAIAAYGARQDICDKILSVEKPGYSTRKLSNCASQFFITTKDCGTTEGLVWTYKDICRFTDKFKSAKMYTSELTYMATKDLFFTIINGKRPIIDSVTQECVMDKKTSDSLFDQYIAEWDSEESRVIVKDGLAVRSPIHCKCPICATCYGYDFQYRDWYPRVGKAVGIIAAQSLSQPGTQMIMKKFQKGGVVSKANEGSSFDMITEKLGMTDLSGKDINRRFLTYDPIAPKSGIPLVREISSTVEEVSIVDPVTGKQVVSKKYKFAKGTKLKEKFEEGEGMWEDEDIHDINECLKYWDFEDAVKYFILAVKQVFAGSGDIAINHFETVTASLIHHVNLVATPNYAVGEFLNLREMTGWDVDRPIATVPTILGYGEVNRYRSDFFGSMNMEAISTCVPRALFMHPIDTLKDVKTQIMFGFKPFIGSSVNPNY